MLTFIKSGSATKVVQSKLFPILVIVAAGLIFTLPAIIYGIPFLSDDGVSHHALWYTHFSTQLWAGDLYPRWLMGMNEGLGSPVFYYYPPVPFFLTSLLKPFFPADLHGWHQLGLSASLALIASGFCAYLWLKDLTDRNSALVAAVLYMVTPYHLAADLYIRGSFAEYWAFVWMPLILFFTHKIVNANKLAVTGLAFSYALLLMTHLPITLIFSPLPVCYAFYISGGGRKLKVTVGVLAGLALGIGLSAVFLWPAMTTQQLVLLNRMTTGYFSYKNWLLFSSFSLWRDEKLPLLLLMLDLAAIASCAFIITRLNPHKFTRRLNIFWLVVAIASIFMMTDLSRPLWLIFPLVQKIQFPWRFNAILSLATTTMLALSIYSFRKSDARRISVVWVTVILLIATWLPATGWAVWRAYPFHNPSQEEVNYKNREIDQEREVPEYYPRWNTAMAEMDWKTSGNEKDWDESMDRKFESLLQRVGHSGGSLSKFNIVEGTGQVRIDGWGSGRIDLHVETLEGLKMNVSQFYFPNWTARMPGESSNLAVQPSQPDGLISLSIPRGSHEVLLEMKQSKAETSGEIISLISLVITLAYLAVNRRRHAERSH
ncbi:MAG: hypothetical protein M3R69_08575 [Acidobacteriota bacterium]|nr:hypothetical protein [Acidobacteriota bacterium]